MYTRDFNRTPSIQHTVCLIGPSPEATAANILKLDAANPPRTFEARDWGAKLLNQAQSVEWLLDQAKQVKRKHLRNAILETLPLFDEYTQQHEVSWFKPLDPIYYEVFPGLVIPINPMGHGLIDGELVSVWPQTWKNSTLTPDQFNLWATIYSNRMSAILPELTKFHWLEMSKPKGKKIRELRVRSNDAARMLSEVEIAEFRQNLMAAVEIVKKAPPKPKKPPRPDPRQGDFFD